MVISRVLLLALPVYVKREYNYTVKILPVLFRHMSGIFTAFKKIVSKMTTS